MGKLTTHVLDQLSGRPGKNMSLRLYRCATAGAAEEMIRNMVTNDDGRCDQPLLAGDDMKSGVYRLEFDVAAYYRRAGVDLPTPPFLDIVEIRFGIADAEAHYHVPLLMSPYGYSTYRGS